MSPATLPVPAPAEPSVAAVTMAEIVDRLGDIPLARIRLLSPSRPATEDDLVLLAEKHDILCELVDGILVEKPVGYYESRLAIVLVHLIEAYLDHNPIAIAAGESGPFRTVPDHVRMPDISVILVSRVTDQMLRTQKVLHVAPDLAIEVLSESNTQKEMARKLREYFKAGVRLVWYIDPKTETARVYRSPKQCETIAGHQMLSGDDVLPGFAVRLSDVFQRARQGLTPNE